MLSTLRTSANSFHFAVKRLFSVWAGTQLRPPAYRLQWTDAPVC